MLSSARERKNLRRYCMSLYHRTKFGGRQSLVRILAASPMQRAWSCSILAVFFIRTTSNYYLQYLLVLVLNDSPRLPSAICCRISLVLPCCSWWWLHDSIDVVVACSSPRRIWTWWPAPGTAAVSAFMITCTCIVHDLAPKT